MLRYKKTIIALVLLLCLSFPLITPHIKNSKNKDAPQLPPTTAIYNQQKPTLHSSNIDPINSSLFETWNFSTHFQNKYNETLLAIPNIGEYYSPMNCTVNNLINRSSIQEVYPTEVDLSLWQFNGTEWEPVGGFSDIANGTGNLFSEIYIYTGNFAIGSNESVEYDIYFEFVGNNSKEIPIIYQEERWIINYNSSFSQGNYSSQISNLSSSLFLELIRGFDGMNWRPISEYQFNENLSIFENFTKYRIEFSVHVLDVVYNEHLEVGDDLALYILPNVNGNLTILFKGVNNDILINDTQILIENEMINYSWIMNSTYPGGIGELSIEFKGDGAFNGSKIEGQILFHKPAQIQIAGLIGDGDEFLNTTRALEVIALVAVYEDIYNNTIIPNGTMEYTIGNVSGVMDYIYLADISGNSSDDMYLYLEFIDLSELRLKPNNYTIDITASKIGYDNDSYQLSLEITSVYCQVITPLLQNNHLNVYMGDPFELDLDLKYNIGGNQWINIQDNVILNFSVYSSSHELIDSWQLDTRYEDPELKGIIGHNDAYPGDYYFRIVVNSPFYYGSTNISLTIKKDVTILLQAPPIITHPGMINLNWICDGVFYGDTRGFVFVAVDGRIFSIQPLLPISFLQIDSNELSAGQHVVQVFIMSDYYTGQFIRTIDVKLSFLEQYGILLLSAIGVIAIAVIILAGYIRRKKKLKRKEWESLGAMMAIKDGMNMFTIRRSKTSKYSYKLSADEDLFTGMIEAIKNFAKEINLSSGDTTKFQGDQGMITIIPESKRRFNLVFLSQEDPKHIESDLKSLFVQTLKNYYDTYVGDWKGDLSVFKVYLNKAQQLINSNSIAKAKKKNKVAKEYSYEIDSN